MAKNETKAIVTIQVVEPKIKLIRGQRVMLDGDLAVRYGIRTAVLTQAVERNTERFPEDFAFELTQFEFNEFGLGVPKTTSGRGGRRKLPMVFTEQGVAMLSSVLRSPMAVRVNIEIMRSFVRIRRLLATPGELVAQLQALAETVKIHDVEIRQIDEILKSMLAEPDEPRRPFGFTPN